MSLFTPFNSPLILSWGLPILQVRNISQILNLTLHHFILSFWGAEFGDAPKRSIGSHLQPKKPTGDDPLVDPNQFTLERPAKEICVWFGSSAGTASQTSGPDLKAKDEQWTSWRRFWNLSAWSLASSAFCWLSGARCWKNQEDSTPSTVPGAASAPVCHQTGRTLWAPIEGEVGPVWSEALRRHDDGLLWSSWHDGPGAAAKTLHQVQVLVRNCRPMDTKIDGLCNMYLLCFKYGDAFRVSNS